MADTKANREILDVCERYRHAMEERDAATLLSLAHPELLRGLGHAAGATTTTATTGSRTCCSKRLSALKTLRYNIEYRRVNIEGHHAQVDIRYDASFQIATEMGDRWERKMNDKRIELENDGKRWLIIAGM